MTLMHCSCCAHDNDENQHSPAQLHVAVKLQPERALMLWQLERCYMWQRSFWSETCTPQSSSAAM